MITLRGLDHHYPPLRDEAGRTIKSAAHRNHGFCWNWLRDFFGAHPEASQRDWLQPAIMGLLELVAYPVLLSVGRWDAIGAWLALKTAAKWGEWTSQRESYNRFLIGNALVVILAFALFKCPWFFPPAPALLD
jgi:hypothetical protein